MQCDYTSKYAQCKQEAIEGARFCAQHSRDPQAGLARQYMLTKAKYRERYSDFADHNEIRSLRDEIAIVRSIMEARMNLIDSDSDLLASCGQIASLAITIERLVKSCHQLESQLGSLLSKPVLLSIASTIVQILLSELAHIDGYELIVDRISDKIVTLIAEAK